MGLNPAQTHKGIGRASQPGGLNCNICSDILNQSNQGKEIWDTVLYEDSEFVCTPTLGSLVEGYVLTIPKTHVISSSALPAEQLRRYWKFTQKISNIIEKRYGNTVIFEHGPAENGSPVGCGVDHAHFHIVPINGSILENGKKLNPDPISWKPIEEIEEMRSYYQNGEEHLLFKKSGGPLLVGTANIIKSQLFRRAIAEELDVPQKYDYNNHAFEEKAELTVKNIGEKPT